MERPASRPAQKAWTERPTMHGRKTATALLWGRSWLQVPNQHSQKVCI